MKRTWVSIALLAMSACSVSLAKPARTWTIAGATTYGKGKLENVALLSTGELQLAPASTSIPGIKANFVWTLATGPDGAAYAGTGAPGALYMLRDDRAELVYKTIEPHVMSVLPMADGTVLVGTAPRGIIWRVQPDGKAEVFADLEEAYVWDMTSDPNGGVYCATGPNGKLIMIGRDGTIEELAALPQANLRCMAATKEGEVWVGTQPDGILYRWNPGGKTVAAYDAEEDEISDIVIEGETVYFSTAQGGETAEQASGTPPGDGASVAPPDPRVNRYTTGPSGVNSVYAYRPSSGATRLLQVPEKFILSLGLRGHQLLAGTGPGGRLLAIAPDGVVKVMGETEATQITAISEDKGASLLATSNDGGILRVEAAHALSGEFTSDVFDAGHLAQWGRIWWHERTEKGQDIRLRVRVGVTAEPDEHWSDWSDWAADPEGAMLGLPMGRYAQMQAVLETLLADSTPTLIDVNVSYKQANRKPMVNQFLMNGVSVLPAENGAAENTGNGDQAQPGTVQFQWDVTDPNEDELLVHLDYRGLDEKDWKTIKKAIRNEDNYQWDTSRIPDGHYLLRITARDSAARAPQEELAVERVSVPVLIDNRRPAIEGLNAVRNADGSYIVSGTAKDQYSHISALQYSRNAGDWLDVFSDDGLMDDREEAFSFRTETLKPGEHVIVVTAKDEAGNVGSGKVMIQTPQQ